MFVIVLMFELLLFLAVKFLFLVSRKKNWKMSRVRGYINPGVGFDEYAESCGYVRIGCADDEFAQLTKLRSMPHKHLRQVLPGESTAPLVSPVQMMMGRECNYSGKGRFSTSDSCHVLSRYLPVCSTPSVVDKMTSCAYVSQFSDDGSLFVAGFQVSEILVINLKLCMQKFLLLMRIFLVSSTGKSYQNI